MDEEYDLNILRPQPQRPSGKNFRRKPTTSIYPNTDNFPTERSSERGSEQPMPATLQEDSSRSGGNIPLAGNSVQSGNATPQLPLPSSSFDDPGGIPPQKTRSVLNLTSSTLFGIYSPTGYDAIRDEPSTPWGTGAQTPTRSVSVDASLIDSQRSLPAGTRRESGAINKDRRQSLHQHGRTGKSRPKSVVGLYAAQFLRKTLLFAIGLAYGAVMRQLHNSRAIAPVRVHAMERPGWWYLGFWGLAGVALGSALPWVDRRFGRRNWRSDASSENWMEGKRQDGKEGLASDGQSLEAGSNRSGLGAEWNPIVRSIGAFVGIAFAIVSIIPCLTNYLTTSLTAHYLCSPSIAWSRAMALKNECPAANPTRSANSHGNPPFKSASPLPL